MSIKVFGDSHSIYFQVTPQVSNYLGYPFRNISIDLSVIKGSTIKGLGKRESSLQAKKEVIDFLKSGEFNEVNDHLVLAFGQVDIELGFYYEKYVKKNDINYIDFIEDVIGSYESFIKTLPIDKSCIIVKGVNLPALVFYEKKAVNYTSRIIAENITDVDEIKSVRLKMLNEFPDDLQRTRMHIKFNILLQHFCSEMGIKYFDINDFVVGENGLLEDIYIPSKLDHHLVDSLKMRKIHIVELLNTIIKN